MTTKRWSITEKRLCSEENVKLTYFQNTNIIYSITRNAARWKYCYRIFLEVCLHESLVVFVQTAEVRRWQWQPVSSQVLTVHVAVQTSDEVNKVTLADTDK